MLEKNNVKQLNDYVESYIKDFFINLESEGSIHTERQYRRGIQNFIKYNFKYDLKYLTVQDLEKVDKHMILSYFNKMYSATNEEGEKLYKNSTINAQLSGVKKFIEYMDFIDIIDFKVSDLAKIKNKKKDSISHETMPMDVVFAMIDDIRINESNLTVEKEWFIRIGVETGLRMSDILKLEKKQFIELSNGADVLIQTRGVNRVKGNKDWKDIIDIELFKEMEDALFIGERSNLFTMSASTIAKTMHRSQERLGVDRGYTPHSLRRTAINNTKELTGDMKAAQSKANHSNIGTTMDGYVDEVEYGATGIFSVMKRTNTNLMNEVGHDILVKALNELGDSTKLLINIKLQEILSK